MMCDFVEMGFIPVRKWRPGRVVEGTSLLRKHMGLNLYRGFESLGLRQLHEKRPLNLAGVFFEKETSDVPADIACGIRRKSC